MCEFQRNRERGESKRRGKGATLALESEGNFLFFSGHKGIVEKKDKGSCKMAIIITQNLIFLFGLEQLFA